MKSSRGTFRVRPVVLPTKVLRRHLGCRLFRRILWMALALHETSVAINLFSNLSSTPYSKVLIKICCVTLAFMTLTRKRWLWREGEKGRKAKGIYNTINSKPATPNSPSTMEYYEYSLYPFLFLLLFGATTAIPSHAKPIDMRSTSYKRDRKPNGTVSASDRSRTPSLKRESRSVHESKERIGARSKKCDYKMRVSSSSVECVQA